MKKASAKTTEAQLLDLLQKVLPKATHDPQLAGKIYQAVESELKTKARAAAFEKFCQRMELPDLDAKTVADVKKQLTESFQGSDVTLKADKKAQTLAVEISMPDGTRLASNVKMGQKAEETSDEPEVTLKFIACPVSLPGDPELIWMLAKRENLTAEEAGIALAKVEEEFWASKMGQKLIRDRVERCFPEFISRVPSGMLNEVGLKRHYKEPEAVKVLRPAGPPK